MKNWLFDDLHAAGYKCSYFQFFQRLITKGFWTNPIKKWKAPVIDIFNRTINEQRHTIRKNQTEWDALTRDQEFRDVLPDREAGVLLRGLSKWWLHNANFPRFSFVHLMSGHFPFPRSNIQMHDRQIQRGIQALLASKNTVVILMSDHGYQISEVGYFLPYLKVVVPLELLKIHPALVKMIHNAIQNGDKTVSVLDLHYLLRGLTLFNHAEVETAGLLSSLDSERSCQASGATFGHCLCDQSGISISSPPEEVVSLLKHELQNLHTKGCTRINTVSLAASLYEEHNLAKWCVKIHTSTQRIFEAHVMDIRNGTFELVMLKQLTSYKNDEKCTPLDANPEFCICARRSGAGSMEVNRRRGVRHLRHEKTEKEVRRG